MKIRFFISVLLILIFPQIIWALTGREIMEKSDKLTQPKTAESRVTMKIYKGSRVDEKEFMLYTKEYPNDEDRLLLSFQKPTHIQLLTHVYKGRKDDQWLVLSSGRVKRIASRDKGKPFVHSHFYYEDLGTRDIDDYTFKYIGDATAQETECFKVEGIKKDEKERVYDKIMLYVRKSDYFVIRIEFYLNGKFHKYLENRDIKIKDGILTPSHIIMSLPGGKDRTELQVQRIDYNVTIEDMKFNKEALR